MTLGLLTKTAAAYTVIRAAIQGGSQMRISMPFSRLFTLTAISAIMALPLVASAQDSSAPATTPPPATPPGGASAMPASPHVVPNGNLVTTLQGSGHFTILLKAVDAAGLSDTLKSAPNITLFAPTDEAFQALPPSQLAQLMAPKNAPLLQKVLTYHLVNAKVDSAKIKGAKGPVATVENTKVVIDGSADVLKVNDADIIQSDVMASNGIIQVIDKVLVPSDVSLPAATAAAGAPSTGG
jgi:uncharacterized surface protein with fasciclin (FAS1) repeats